MLDADFRSPSLDYDDNGKWQPAPFFDVTFSPFPFGEHATACAGFGKLPPLKAIPKLAESSGFARWVQAKTVIQEIVDIISQFANVTNDLGVSAATCKMLNRQLEENSTALKQGLSI